MNKKIFGIITLLIISFLAIYSLKNPEIGNQPAHTPASNTVTPMPQPTNLPANKNLLYEGPIYETHPYYYDGTFRGLTEKIPFIADLGVKTIYLMPIWEHRNKNPQYLHIYLINDYYKIDPEYGTAEDLKKLVDTVHRYNIDPLRNKSSYTSNYGKIGVL